MPVVWCSDPNSSSKKPTAFALQGIQLQGNLSEKHVLAVRELINAASEGRLLLPSEGGIVLLDCGVGVGSVIIQDNNSALADSNENHDELETILHQKKFYCSETDHDNSATAATNELASDFQKYEILYEFLCCARCISDGTKGCNRSSRSVEKYLDAKMSSGCLSKRAGNLSRLINARRKNAVSFKSEKRPLKRNQVSGAKCLYMQRWISSSSGKISSSNTSIRLSQMIWFRTHLMTYMSQTICHQRWMQQVAKRVSTRRAPSVQWILVSWRCRTNWRLRRVQRKI